MNPSLLAANVLPNYLNHVGDSFGRIDNRFQLALSFQDLVKLSGGYDFLLQASNGMCAKTAFNSLGIQWVIGQLDPQGIAALRASGASFTSSLLQQAVEGQVQAGAAIYDILLQFTPKDVLFDAPHQCRVRFNVTVAIGNLHVRPKVPQTVPGLTFGETVQEVGNIIGSAAQALSSVFSAQTPQPLAVRSFPDPRIGSSEEQSVFNKVNSAFAQLNRTITLDFYNWFTVSDWLGGGVLEIAAPYAATGDQPSATIKVIANVSQSAAHFTNLTYDSALLLSDADPCNLVLETTQRIRRQGSLSLVDEVSLVGGSATAYVSELHTFAVDAFPCSTGNSPLNVVATIVAGRVGSQAVPAFIGGLTYGVVWSADAVRLLVRYCWDTNAFPRSIPQTSEVRLSIDGVDQVADAISVFKLDTLDIIELEYDSNARRDVLYTRGLARVVPQFIRLRDGRELTAQNPSDPVFAPSAPQAWAALGSLTEDLLTASSPDLLWFERAVTRGVTSRLGRPFIEPAQTAEVVDSSLSATAQRVALLVS